MVLDPIPQSLPVHFCGSRPQPPTSRHTFSLSLVIARSTKESSRYDALQHTLQLTLQRCNTAALILACSMRSHDRRESSLNDSLQHTLQLTLQHTHTHGAVCDSTTEQSSLYDALNTHCNSYCNSHCYAQIHMLQYAIARPKRVPSLILCNTLHHTLLHTHTHVAVCDRTTKENSPNDPLQHTL